MQAEIVTLKAALSQTGERWRLEYERAEKAQAEIATLKAAIQAIADEFERVGIPADGQIDGLVALWQVQQARFRIEQAQAEIVTLKAALAERFLLSVSEIREGEDNSGPLESTDLYLRGRGLSLLVNAEAGSKLTYALGVDGQHVEGGTIGVPTEATS